MAKPTIDQPNWGTTLNDHLDSLASDIDARETPAGAQAKADAAVSQVATDAPNPATEVGAALSDTFASKWRAATAYVAGDVRQAPDGSTIRRNTNGTSAATFTTTELAAPVLSAPTTATTGGTIEAGTTYFYKATALNALGETIGSTEVSRAIAAALTTPVNAAFTTATTGGTLAAGTYSYRVSATNAAGETLASTATTQTVAAALAAPVLAAPTTATTGGTLAAATYYYKATAINAVGETIGSNEVSIATTGTTSTVGLSWAAITGATGYKIYRATVAGGESTSPALVATLGEVTTYTDTGTAVSAGAVPATNTTATTTNTVTVNWGEVAGATGYKVYGRTDAGELLMASVGAVTTWTDTGAVTPAGALPASNTTATDTNTVGLSWAAITGATGYKIYRATATGGQSTSPALVASVGDVTTYTDTGTAVTAGAVPATGTTSEKAHWTAVAAVAGTMEQVALSAAFARKDSAPLSVTEYGAVADWDGTTGTDNLAAFQDALAAASDGQRVYAPAGRYYLSGTLTIDKVIDFDCAAGGIMENTLGTQLVFAAGQSGLIVQAGGAGWRVGPFNIDSESTAAGTDVGLFVGGPNSGGGIIDRVTVNGFGSHGIHLKAGADYGGGNVNNSVLIRVRSTYNRGDGVRIEGSDANACHLIKPDVVGNYGWGINLEDSAQTVVEHPHADQQYNSAPGAFRDDGNSNDWRWIYSEGAVKITFDTGCAYARMSQGQYGAATVEKLTANNITINDTYLGDYYRRDLYGASAHTWRMSSDVYSAAHFALTYQSGSAGAAKNYMVVSRNLDKFLLFAKVDPNADGTLDLGSTSLQWRNGFFSSYVRVGAVATASRPSAATAGAGAHMFDTTLGKPIWSDGTNWKDATGAAV